MFLDITHKPQKCFACYSMRTNRTEDDLIQSRTKNVNVAFFSALSFLEVCDWQKCPQTIGIYELKRIYKEDLAFRNY